MHRKRKGQRTAGGPYWWALILVLATASPARATCPRTASEKTRRILPGVFMFPTGLLVLRHQQTHVAMPSVGALVRVSVSTPDGVQFSEGTFVAASDSAFRLAVGARDTMTVARANTQCLQVYRRSRVIGALLGFPIGVASGMLAGFGLGLTSGDPWVMASSAFLGTVVGAVAGPLVGSRRGASAWDVAWERPR